MSSFCSRWLDRSGPKFHGSVVCGGFASRRLFLFRTGVQHSTPGSGNFILSTRLFFLVAVESWSSLSSPAVGGKAQILWSDEPKKRQAVSRATLGDLGMETTTVWSLAQVRAVCSPGPRDRA